MPPKKSNSPFGFDTIDFMKPSKKPAFPSLWNSEPSKEKKSDKDCRLTDSEKRYFLKLISNCEFCNKNAQEIHHIKACSEGGTKAYNNLIVLCGYCHNQAHEKGGFIPSSDLRKCIQGRKPTIAKNIKDFLKRKQERKDNNKIKKPRMPWEL